MPKYLVIVESPAKCKTINRYLGKDYVVSASMGHVRDLPARKFAIDIENDFAPEYVTIRGKGKILTELRKLAKPAELVYLATDYDREGEAIAWHLCKALKIPRDKVRRVTFNEITKKAIDEAFASTHSIDNDKFNAQQARRILDRIVGYKLSPLLRKKVAKGLSAGRVQSVAVMLVVDREKEIRAFEKEEYWKIIAKLLKSPDADAEKDGFEAELKKIGGEDFVLPDEKSTNAALAEIQKEKFTVSKVERKQRSERPRPPFITSTLQQQASTRLGFSAKKTMFLAQKLYEGVDLGVEGQVALITYMRTDSVHLAAGAVAEAHAIIEKDFGRNYLPEKPVFYKSKKAAQEAHEAIRPTEPHRHPDAVSVHLEKDMARLYELIWRRFMACQMNPAVFDVTAVDIDAGKYTFRANGRLMKFEGHLAVMGTAGRVEQQILPEIAEGGEVFPAEITPSQHFTQPPPRYTEASLVLELEDKGIGRPSTYAPIISTIQARGYVEQQQRRFYATELGEIVTDKLVTHFPDIINTEFTSKMEEELDTVEEGKTDWVKMMRGFYTLFEADLKKAEETMKSEKGKESGVACEKCGKPMVYRWSKQGKFLGCSDYPDCKHTMTIEEDGQVSAPEEIEGKCPKCESGLTVKSGRFGKFIACSNYPDCKFTKPYFAPGEEPAGDLSEEKCPTCGAPMALKRGRWGQFLACTKYPDCKTTKKIGAKPKAKPDPKTKNVKEAGGAKPKKAAQAKSEDGETVKCDLCGAPMVERMGKRGKFLGCSAYPKCKNIKPLDAPDEPEETDEKCPNCGAPMLLRSGRWGRFLACSAYPKCKTTKKIPK